MKIMVVFGTRPEAIKMCPLICELKQRKELDVIVCLSGQHKDLVYPILKCFDISEDYNLNIMKENQTVTDITVDTIKKIEPVLIKEKPEIVLVHGDTTTSLSAALSAFYQKIPVAHIEAGLRSYNRYSPFPEEMNRRLLSQITTYHFAPTLENKNNLEKENIKNNIYITGNTVIDSFKTTVRKNYKFENDILNKLDDKYKYILLTAHRRENIGIPLENICDAVIKIIENNKDVKVIYPVHPNPKVKEVVYRKLGNNNGIFLIDPVSVLDMHNLMDRCYLIMTDSGGIQEEAPSFDKPVIVLRNETERMEIIENGAAVLAGTDSNDIFNKTQMILDDELLYKKMANTENPYGDGYASKRIADIITDILGK